MNAEKRSAERKIAAQAADRRETFIIDARLALSRAGLVFALQLAREAPVWLTRGFWTLVDSAYFYRSFPCELATEEEDDSEALLEERLEALSLWHAAWLNGVLNGAFSWVGDARRESAIPFLWDADLITRYERLTQSFEAAPAAPLATCGREAIALAAALSSEAPVILTRAQNAGRPLLCREAATRAIDIFDPETDERGGASLPRPLETTARHMRRLGAEIALVRALAPAALTLAACAHGVDDIRPDSIPEPPIEFDPWRGACLFWRRLE